MENTQVLHIEIVISKYQCFMIHILSWKKANSINLKINVIPNGLEKYGSFNINNKLSFIESF